MRSHMDLIADLDKRPLDCGTLKRSILEKLVYSVGKNPQHATEHDRRQPEVEVRRTAENKGDTAVPVAQQNPRE